MKQRLRSLEGVVDERPAFYVQREQLVGSRRLIRDSFRSPTAPSITPTGTILRNRAAQIASFT